MARRRELRDALNSRVVCLRKRKKRKRVFVVGVLLEGGVLIQVIGFVEHFFVFFPFEHRTPIRKLTLSLHSSFLSLISLLDRTSTHTYRVQKKKKDLSRFSRGSFFLNATRTLFVLLCVSLFTSLPLLSLFFHLQHIGRGLRRRACSGGCCV